MVEMEIRHQGIYYLSIRQIKFIYTTSKTYENCTELNRYTSFLALYLYYEQLSRAQNCKSR